MHPIRLLLIGMLMGLADLIPGISSGTVAYSLNIYKKWIDALESISISKLLSLQFRAFFRNLDLKVLLPLLIGIFVSILIFTNLVFLVLKNTLTKDIFYLVVSFLLMLSCISFSKEVKIGSINDWWFIFYGFSIAGVISILPQLTYESTNLLFIFFGALLASFAMMLPGISGSFVLLLLNQYEFLILQIKDFINSIFHLQIFNLSTVFISVFLSGVLAGVAIFSKILKKFLENHSHKTNLVLFGLMFGCIFWFVNLVAKIVLVFALVYYFYKKKLSLVKD